jgi:shikimate kinase
MKHLVLVGLPGSGKTTLGRAAASEIGLPFLDFDEEIERRTGLSPTEFFRQRSEDAFRAQELALSRELVGRHTIVVAPGGGWIMQEASREVLRPHALLVYLQVSPATAAVRLGPEAQRRPLLAAASDPVDALTRLLALRGPQYETAHHILDTEAVDLQALTHEVASLARQCLAGVG